MHLVATGEHRRHPRLRRRRRRSRPRRGGGSSLASVQRPSASSSPLPCPRRMASASARRRSPGPADPALRRAGRLSARLITRVASRISCGASLRGRQASPRARRTRRLRRRVRAGDGDAGDRDLVGLVGLDRPGARRLPRRCWSRRPELLHDQDALGLVLAHQVAPLRQADRARQLQLDEGWLALSRFWAWATRPG